MDAERYAIVTDLFNRALEITPSKRDTFLEIECAGDTELLSEVHSLLSHHTQRSLYDLLGVRAGRDDSMIVDLKPGDCVHNFRILDSLGSGAMGIVYLAEQLSPVRRKVALKVLRVGMDTKELLARFNIERQALALMDHPAIARIYDAGSTDRGRPYFAMELVDGLPITEYCNRHRLDVPSRLRLFIDVCNGVQHAHQRGIIHRDIKPSNVLVTEYEGKPQPKIIDFGIARATDSALTEQTLHTRKGMMLGTPSYMSPEQAEMGEAPDTRTDVYSLGALIYELLTDTPPLDFRSEDYDLIRRTIATVDPPKPSTRLSSLGTTPVASIAASRQMDPKHLIALLRTDLDWIVMRALEKDRHRRYDSASALRADVERYLTGDPVVARPPTLHYQVRKYVRRHRYLVLGSAAVSIALMAGMAATMWQAQQARDRLAALRSTASAMVTQLHAYHDVPSTLAARRELAAYASRLLDEMGNVGLDDVESSRQRASALEALGRLQADYYSQSTGEVEAGMKNLVRAMEIRTRLFGQHPDNVVLARELLNARYLCATMDDPATARLFSAIAIGEKFVAADTSDHDTALILSQLYDRAAWSHYFDGDGDAGMAFDERAFRLRYRIAQQLPGDLEWLRYLGVSYRAMAVTQNDYQLAETYARASLAISQRIASAQPFSYRALYDVSSAHRVMSDVLRWRGRFEEALPHVHECLRIRRILVRQDNENLRGLHYVALAEHEIGEVHLAAGNLDSALFYHSAGMRAQREVAQRGQAGLWKDSVAWSDLQMARTSAALLQHDSAIVWYERALPRLYAGIPGRPLEVLMAWRYLDEYSHLLELAGRRAEADSVHLYSVVVVDSLAQKLLRSPCGAAHEDVVAAYCHLALELTKRRPGEELPIMQKAHDSARARLDPAHPLADRIGRILAELDESDGNSKSLTQIASTFAAVPDTFRLAPILYFQSTPLWGLNAWPRDPSDDELATPAERRRR